MTVVHVHCLWLTLRCCCCLRTHYSIALTPRDLLGCNPCYLEICSVQEGMNATETSGRTTNKTMLPTDSLVRWFVGLLMRCCGSLEGWRTFVDVCEPYREYWDTIRIMLTIRALLYCLVFIFTYLP